jgi:formylglycine-generating enzyme required for sulfatase activity
VKAKIYLLLILFIFGACSRDAVQANTSISIDDGFVLVSGGSFVNSNSNLYDTIMIVSDFYIGIYPVTQEEWIHVMGNNPSQFEGENLPVETISWYDAVEYCNMRSLSVGLQPYYTIDKDTDDPNNLSEVDDIRWTVTLNPGANGYRLPTEVEWEYAASGGQLSEHFYFSGSNDPDEVAWHYKNSGDEYLEGFWHFGSIEGNNGRTRPVGQRLPNELGLYDMSGNVREWCWDRFGEETVTMRAEGRSLRGGGWLGQEESCAIYYRNGFDAHYAFNDLGLRLVRGVY